MDNEPVAESPIAIIPVAAGFTSVLSKLRIIESVTSVVLFEDRLYVAIGDCHYGFEVIDELTLYYS